jgi:hypothetical protein
VYKSIAKEAYELMKQYDEKNRRPKPNGEPGWIITYGPNQTSFKQAMISIVFTGMWLEAWLHLHIIKKIGPEKWTKSIDFSSYETKLKLLEINDESIIQLAEKFRGARKELVHEKAHFTQDFFKTAQDEAEVGYQLICKIESILN